MKQIEVRCNLCARDDWFVRFPSALDGEGAVEVDAFRCTSTTYGSHPQIVQCRGCGYVYANPRWERAALLDAYQAVEDERYVAERIGRERTFKERLAALEQMTEPGLGQRLLDVGAYIGVFVEVATEAGWDACGVEPSHWAVQVAKKRRLPVFQGTLETAAKASVRAARDCSDDARDDSHFDVITMWDVIEHLTDPAKELARAYTLLKPGGVIAVHTMDVESLAARLMGRRWPWLMDMHLHYFSRRTLSQMLQKQGFELIWIGVEGRYVRLGYLASRLEALAPGAGRLATGFIRRLNLAHRLVPVNFGDLFTVYARRPRISRRAHTYQPGHHP